jgi:prevent-host-death family protein
MKVASIADVKARFSAYLQASEDGPVVVTRNGKPVAVVLAVKGDDELEELILAHSPRLRAILDRSRAQIRAGQRLSHEELWSRMAGPVGKPKPRRRSSRSGGASGKRATKRSG